MRARHHRLGPALGIAVALLVAELPVHASPGQVLRDPEAQAHFDEAQRHFGEEDYAAAIPELKAAYALEPNPMLLYAWGQAERLAGSCERAVGLYRRFLETNPAPEQRQLAEANLVDCEAELPDDALDPEAPATEDEPPDDDGPPRRWYADPVGGVLLGVGVAGLITGGALMGLAQRRIRQAPNADIEDEYYDVIAQAERFNTAGGVVLGVGGVLVLSGVIRYAIVARKGRRARESAAQARWHPVWTGAGVALRGRF